MGQLLNYIQLLFSIVPAIMQMVKAIEAPGGGALKAEAVIQIALAALNTIDEGLAKAIGLDRVKGFIQFVINTVVRVFNSLGVFQSSTPPSTTTVVITSPSAQG